MHLRRHRCHHLVRVGHDTGVTVPAVCPKKVLRCDSGVLLCSVMASHVRQLQAAQSILPGLSTSVVSSIDDRNYTKLDPLHEDQQHLLQVPSSSTDTMVTPLSPLSPMATLSIKEQTDVEDNNARSEEEKVKELQSAVANLLQQKHQYIESIEQTKANSQMVRKSSFLIIFYQQLLHK